MYDWFFRDDGPADGAMNMAVDEYLLASAGKGLGRPVLRLYSFSPPAITVGYHQDPLLLIDPAAAAADGVDVVRRITGGRALLHKAEITYCVASPLGRPAFGGGLQETFISIAGAIVAALRGLGVDAVVSEGRSGSPAGETASPCLASASRHEITAGGRKIVGSAQRRTAGAFIQHGSILIGDGSEDIVRYLKGGRLSLGGLVTNINAETGCRFSREDVACALREGFAETLGAGFGDLRIPAADLESISAAAESKRAEYSKAAEGRVVPA